ncbi:MAG: class II fructose-bisphosphatase [Alphaproteobacteria bacterium]|nr:class II fructose-bisphosphatase [Alphaproteobacteria bacterium]
MDRNLALEAVRVTEAAALAAARHLGRGDERAADEAAARAMHEALNALGIDGTVVIGEGESVPVLHIGDKVGGGKGPRIDIALDPLEGATIAAKGGYNALSVIAVAQVGGLMAVPEVYMDKIAVGGGLPAGVVDLDETPEANIKNLAKAKGVEVEDLLVCTLDRPRHEELIWRVREAGARMMLISDGDTSGCIATCMPSGIDMYMGIGDAPEGVLAAAALRCAGGQMQGRLLFRNEDDKARGRRCGITDFSRRYEIADLARGEVMFAATGVTTGALLQGIRRVPGGAVSHSLVLRSSSGTMRFIESHHNFVRSGK